MENGGASGRVFPQEVVRHLFPRPRDPCSEWPAGREGRRRSVRKILLQLQRKREKNDLKKKTGEIADLIFEFVKRFFYPRELMGWVKQANKRGRGLWFTTLRHGW